MLKLTPPAGPFVLRTAGRNFTTPTLEDASSVSRSLIREEGDGASTWGGASVHEEDGRLVAVLSYNGRAYLPAGTNPDGRPLPGDLEFDLSAESVR